MSTQDTLTDDSDTDETLTDRLGAGPATASFHARVMEYMTVEEFDAIVAGELDPDEWVQRHDLAGGFDQ